MFRSIWQQLSKIGFNRLSSAKSAQKEALALSNQIAIIGILLMVFCAGGALLLDEILLSALLLPCCLIFLPIWLFNAKGWLVVGRNYAAAAIYFTALITDKLILNSSHEIHLFCLATLPVYFAMLWQRRSELLLHILLNTIAFLLICLPPAGANWSRLANQQAEINWLIRIGSLAVGLTSLYIWINSRQRIDNLINSQKNFYENIINTINLPIVVFDDQLRFYLANKTAFRKEEVRQWVIGKTELEYAQMTGKFHERASNRMQKLQQSLAKNSQVIFEESFEIQGYKRTNIGVIAPLVTEDGKKFLVAYLIDISSLRRYEECLRQSQQTFEAVFENATDALFLINTATTRIENCNAAALELFGWKDKSEIKGKLIDTTLIGVPSAIHEQVVEAILQKGKWEGEYTYTRTDGSTFPGSVAVTRFMRQHEQFTLLRITDLTAQKQAEEAIRQALQKAREAAEAKSNFLSKVSHEIRTPLNAIVGLSRLMFEDPAAITQQNLEVVCQSSASLLEMVNEILDFSKLESGSETLNEQPAEWRQAVQRTLERIRWQAERKGLKLVQEIDPHIPHCLVVDMLRLEQILNNLLSNAVKFTHQGYISVAVTGEPLPQQRYQLNFAIADTGIGIPDEKKTIIFESFRQADKTIAYQYGGTGLGLSISRQLIEMMGGKILVENNPEGGSIFKFYLILQIPVECGQESLPTMAENQSYDLSGIKILMAEDNVVNQFVARQIIGRWKAQLTFANNGKEAIELLAKNQYHLVLMDLQMPVMDGIEAAQYIRNAPPESGINSRIPIIALTADALPETREKIKAAGMNDLVVKPFDNQRLYALIKSLLD